MGEDHCFVCGFLIEANAPKMYRQTGKSGQTDEVSDGGGIPEKRGPGRSCPRHPVLGASGVRHCLQPGVGKDGSRSLSRLRPAAQQRPSASQPAVQCLDSKPLPGCGHRLSRLAVLFRRPDQGGHTGKTVGDTGPRHAVHAVPGPAGPPPVAFTGQQSVHATRDQRA